MTAYPNWLKSVFQNKWHVTLKIEKKTFSYTFLDGLKCALEKHFQAELHWNSGYDNEPEAKTESSILSLSANFRHCVYIFAKTWTICTLGKRDLLQLNWNRGRDMAPEPKDDELPPFFEPYFFRCRFFSNWTSNFQIISQDSYMPPSQTLKHETYRCSQIWPTIMSFGFIGVV